MRAPILLFTASCRIFFILLASCFAAQHSYSQQSTPPADHTVKVSRNLLLPPNIDTTSPNINNELKKGSQTFTIGLEQQLPDSLQGADEGVNEELTSLAKPYSKDVFIGIIAFPEFRNTPSIPGLMQNFNQPGDSALNQMMATLFDLETDLLIHRFADMIEVEADEVANIPLYKFIDEWYGVPYKYGGTDNSGIDCSAFSQKLYGSIYSVDILRTSRQQHKSCELIKKYADAQEGDLVFFRIHRLRISHVGVYLANGYFVHASRSRGIMISSLNDRYWHRRYAGCGRIEREERDAAESDFLQ